MNAIEHQALAMQNRQYDPEACMTPQEVFESRREGQRKTVAELEIQRRLARELWHCRRGTNIVIRGLFEEGVKP